MDYQLLGLLNLNFNPRFGMALGWRYMYEDYRPTTHEFVYNPTISGVIAGLNFNLGGKPPIPPTTVLLGFSWRSLCGRSGYSDCDGREPESEMERALYVDRRRRYRQWSDGKRQHDLP